MDASCALRVFSIYTKSVQVVHTKETSCFERFLWYIKWSGRLKKNGVRTS